MTTTAHPRISTTIVQLVTPNIDDYARYSVASCYLYARRHHCQFHVQREQSLGDLHINWSKIDLLQKTLLETLLEVSTEFRPDYVMLLDADTIIINPERGPEAFAGRGDKESLIFMPRDTPFLSGLFRPNAGFILVKNTEAGKEIIDRWLDAAYNEGKHLNDIHPRNQRVYWKYVMPRYKKQQVLLPRRYFAKPLWLVPVGNPAGRFLYHVTQTRSRSRSGQMKDMYMRYLGDREVLQKVTDILADHPAGMVDMMAEFGL